MESVTFNGTSVSSGISYGEIVVLENLYSHTRKTDDVLESDTKLEVNRLEAALKESLNEINELRKLIETDLSSEENLIFEVYSEVLRDKYFIDEIKYLIVSHNISAEKAVRIGIKKYISMINKSNNELVEQKKNDINDIKTRILRNLSGVNEKLIEAIKPGQIVLFEEILPSVAAALANKKIAGVLVSKGAGYLSHSAIILRALQIPTLNNINFKEIKKYNKKLSIIDGINGVLIVNPDQAQLENYKKNLEDLINGNTSVDEECSESKIKTKDGQPIGIFVNISNIGEFKVAKLKNVNGIGMVRTETLFIDSEKLPDEKRQVLIYSDIARIMKDRSVIIRTADISEGKLPSFVSRDFYNKKKGKRGISLSLTEKELFLTQIRSVLRASNHGDVSITFPMVNSAEEIREAKELIQLAKAQLISEKNKVFTDIKTGAVVETINAVHNLEEILNEVDFINIGTNDLLEQTIGIDRESSSGDMMEYLQPDFLRIIKYCIGKTNEMNKKVVVCGEMAGETLGALILVGLGAKDLSMSPNKTMQVENMIRNINCYEAKDLADRVLKIDNVDEMREVVSEWVENNI